MFEYGWAHRGVNPIIAIDHGVRYVSCVALSDIGGDFREGIVHCINDSDVMDKGVVKCSRARERGMKRRARKQIKRRRYTKKRLMRVLREYGYDTLADNCGYAVRAAATDTKVSSDQFAGCLYHCIKNPGYRTIHGMEEDAKLKKERELGRAALESAIIVHGTLSKAILAHPELTHHRQRYMVRTEIEDICEKQSAPEGLCERVLEIHDFLRPLQSHEHLVGFCTLDPKFKRASAYAPSTILFKHLQYINNLRVDGDPLSAEQRKILQSRVGKWTITEIRAALGIPKSVRINDMPDQEDTRGVSADLLTQKYPERARAELDKMAYVISTATTVEDVRTIFGDAVADDYAKGDFNAVRGHAALSAEAMQRIIPFLFEGLSYAESVKRAGYKLQGAVVEKPASPSVQRSMNATLKLLDELLAKYPDTKVVHLESAREFNVSPAKRKEAHIRALSRAKERSKLLKSLADKGVSGVTEGTLKRLELHATQDGIDLYTGKAIPIESVLDGSANIDHVFPKAQYNDNRAVNCVLTLSNVNRDKGNRTPHDWLSKSEYALFVKRVADSKFDKVKKAYLSEKTVGVQSLRVLSEHRWATSWLLQEIKQRYPKLVVVSIVPKATSTARRLWGLKEYKPEFREDVRNHAVDAFVIGSITHRELLRFHRYEKPFNYRPDMEARVAALYDKIEVRRQISGRVRGEMHQESIRSISKDGIVRRRVTVIDKQNRPIKAGNNYPLVAGDLDKMSVGGREGTHQRIKDALLAWITAGYPEDALPRGPDGSVIRRVTLDTTDSVRYKVRGGTSGTASGSLVRLEIYNEAEPKSRSRKLRAYPVYNFDILSGSVPPRKGSRYKIIHAGDAVELITKSGEVLSGYFVKFSRGSTAGVGSLIMSPSIFSQRVDVKQQVRKSVNSVESIRVL